MQKRQTIRQTLSSLIVFSSLLAGMVSCKKDKDIKQDTPPPAASRLSEYKNGEEFIRFTYNADGTVSKATLKSELNTNDNIVEYAISYDVAKKISSIQTTAGEKIVPVYENNKLIRSDVFEGAERTGYTNYVFENNLLKRVTLYWGAGTNDFQPYFELIFSHDNAGNNTETVAMIATGEPGHLERAGHVVYKFDSKPNPLLGQQDLLVLLMQSASKNNIIQEDHFDPHLVLEDRYTYNYTYKTNGLPRRAEVINGLPGQTPTTSQVEYIYQ